MCYITVQKYNFPRSCKTRNNTTIDVVVPDVIYLSLYILYNFMLRTPMIESMARNFYCS